MRVNPDASHPALRLVRPPGSAGPVVPRLRIAPLGSAAGYHRFDSLSIAAPSAPAAQRRLAFIRRTLVAGRTDVPIHFRPATPAAPDNPYAITYQRAAADPAERNGAATSGTAEWARG